MCTSLITKQSEIDRKTARQGTQLLHTLHSNISYRYIYYINIILFGENIEQVLSITEFIWNLMSNDC